MSADSYRKAAAMPPLPAEPPSCPCGMSLETRQAFAAVGGWWHNADCVQWHKDKAEESKGRR